MNMENQKFIPVNETLEVESEYIKHKNEILNKVDLICKKIERSIGPDEYRNREGLFEYVYSQKVLSFLNEWGKVIDNNTLSDEFSLKIEDLIKEGEESIDDILKQKNETGMSISSLLSEIRELVEILKKAINVSIMFDSLNDSNYKKDIFSKN
jgi:hypothetical protein